MDQWRAGDVGRIGDPMRLGEGRTCHRCNQFLTQTYGFAILGYGAGVLDIDEDAVLA
jgi:hypothetical protein